VDGAGAAGAAHKRGKRASFELPEHSMRKLSCDLPSMSGYRLPREQTSVEEPEDPWKLLGTRLPARRQAVRCARCAVVSVAGVGVVCLVWRAGLFRQPLRSHMRTCTLHTVKIRLANYRVFCKISTFRQTFFVSNHSMHSPGVSAPASEGDSDSVFRFRFDSRGSQAVRWRLCT